jgi:hypothetical protein
MAKTMKVEFNEETGKPVFEFTGEWSGANAHIVIKRTFREYRMYIASIMRRLEAEEKKRIAIWEEFYKEDNLTETEEKKDGRTNRPDESGTGNRSTRSGGNRKQK